jgi:hypothetical protein
MIFKRALERARRKNKFGALIIIYCALSCAAFVPPRVCITQLSRI